MVNISNMNFKYFVIFATVLMRFPAWALTETLASTELGYQLNDTSAECGYATAENRTLRLLLHLISSCDMNNISTLVVQTTIVHNCPIFEVTGISKEYLDSSADPPGPPDSHEAMHNRELSPKLREKRSFEFLVGLINNNSKYEVVRSEPESSLNKETPKKSKNTTSDATNLLLDLLTKIVTYPDHWRRIHEMLKNLDEDLISSQHILKYQMEKQNLKNHSPDSKRKLMEDHKVLKNKWNQQSIGTTTNKWPTFDDYEETIKPSTKIESSPKKPESKISEKSSYQKNFSYHKVTVSGKPAHLKKNPTAYIAVSAISPKPSNSEEDFILETELHRLKPWKNKNSKRKV